jgi:Holliday junction resolvase RusA-like endonuclease
MMYYLVPWPPSVNQYWRAVKGRNILSEKARKWKKLAEQQLMTQKIEMMEGPAVIIIHLYPPTRRKYDIDNRVKAILDLLVKCGIIEDDDNEHVVQLTVKHAAVCRDNPGAKIAVMPCHEL